MHKQPSTKVGDIYTSNSGDVVVVTKYITSKKMTVQFEDGVEIQTTHINLKKGSFSHPTKGKIFAGDTFTSNKGEKVEVVEYIDCVNVAVKWEDGLVTRVRSKELREGNFRHPTNWKIPVGSKFKLNCGETVEVIEYNSATNIVVEFSDGLRIVAPKSRLEKGSVAHPTRGVRIGQKITTFSGWGGEVIEYNNAHDVVIRWQDGSTQRTSTTYVKSGSIKPAMQPSVAGVGYTGYPMLKGDKDSSAKSYLHWTGMLGRCYDEKTRAMPKNWSYHDCTVDTRWHNYSVFKLWVEQQVGYGGACNQIDKDILVKGNRVYSPETCILLPAEINQAISNGSTKGKVSGLPSGITQIDNGFVARCCTDKGREYLGFFKTPEEGFVAYKECKENYIKRLATKWKDQIDPRAYQALMNYTVEITD